MGNHILTDVYPDLPKTIDRSLESNRVNASHKLMMIGALRDAAFSLKTAQKKTPRQKFFPAWGEINASRRGTAATKTMVQCALWSAAAC